MTCFRIPPPHPPIRNLPIPMTRAIKPGADTMPLCPLRFQRKPEVLFLQVLPHHWEQGRHSICFPPSDLHPISIADFDGINQQSRTVLPFVLYRDSSGSCFGQGVIAMRCHLCKHEIGPRSATSRGAFRFMRLRGLTSGLHYR